MLGMCFSSVFTKPLNLLVQSKIVGCRSEKSAENTSLEKRARQLQVFEQSEFGSYKTVPGLRPLRQVSLFSSLTG